MEQFNITGMSCAACSARVEKAVSSVDGVESCTVSFLTNSMGVEGTASAEDIISAVEKAGYGASVKGREKEISDDSLKDTETPLLIKRLIASIVFLIILMYFSMGHGMLNLPLPELFENNPVAVALVQMILAAIVMVINQRFFVSGFRGIIHRSPNMDTLVSLGSFSSFAWSVFVLFKMISMPDKMLLDELYFESAAMILTLITVGKILEARSKGKTTDALKALIKIKPKTATVIKDGVETEIPVENVKTGDIFVVKAGSSVAVDGIVNEGFAAVDESALTGESIPVDKTVGSFVSAATTVKSGYLKCEASRVGEDTTLSQIIKTVSEAAATKAPIAKIADRVSGVFVPVVMLIAAITTAVWLILGRELSFSLARGISVLVISCPCALGLATPVTIMVGNGIGARNGILFKTAASLEQAGKTQIVVLDKTGTVTEGKPSVTDVISDDGVDENEFLRIAYSLEEKSEHPLARAVRTYAEETGVKPFKTEQFKTFAGNGVSAEIDGKSCFAGNLKYISNFFSVPDRLVRKADEFSASGKTPLFFVREGRVFGLIAVADTIKPDSQKAVTELKNMGIRVVLLTGDNEQTANVVGNAVGVDRVIASVLPDGKQRVVEELKKLGEVAMVGDGINDAIALTAADTGIAIGAGTDVAIDAADVVLMNSSLLDVAKAIRLSRRTLLNIKENLFWAFIYNVIGIPLAAGVWISLFGWQLSPMFGAAAMSLSSFCVVTNSLRLNLIDIRNSKRDKKTKSVELSALSELIFKEETKMTKTIKIKGMMCTHCEATVKKALEETDGVETAVVSHENGTAVVTLSKDVDNSVLKAAVESKDFEVCAIE